MSNIAINFKRNQRIVSLISKAIEKCFKDPEIKKLSVSYDTGVYYMEINADIDVTYKIYALTSNENPEICANEFLKKILKALDYRINLFQSHEDEIMENLQNYGCSDSDSPALKLTSTLMLKRIIETLNHP